MTYVLCEVLGWKGIWVSESAAGSPTWTWGVRSTSPYLQPLVVVGGKVLLE